MSASIDVYGVDYTGPQYEPTTEVLKFHNLPRFGRSSDATNLFSSNPDEQASYAAGLIVLLVFAMIFFIFWGAAIITWKCMGAGNAGVLSGDPFIVPGNYYDADADFEDKKMRRQRKIPLIARILFIIISIILIIFSILLVAKGVTKLEGTATTAEGTLVALRDKIESAEEITNSIQEVGMRSVRIRDKVVDIFHTVMCDDPNVEKQLGVNLVDIGVESKMALNMLSNFIYDYLVAFRSGLNSANKLTQSAEAAFAETHLVGWPVLVLAVALFIMPALFVIGVGFAIMDVRIRTYQLMLSYVILPSFALMIFLCIIGCCVLIPIGAMNSDVCVGSGSIAGGPDDTILTAYQNILGMDSKMAFLLVAYYTQGCAADYYPFDSLGTYFDQLDAAQTSLDKLINVLNGNLDFIQKQCGSDGFTPFLVVARSMRVNLQLLKSTVDEALNLVNCEDINRMYVNAVHDAGCTESPAAMYWIFVSLMVISVCGMTMISLRSAYLPSNYLGKIPEPSDNEKSASKNEPMSHHDDRNDSQTQITPIFQFDDEDSVSDISDGDATKTPTGYGAQAIVVRRYEGGVPSAPPVALFQQNRDDGGFHRSARAPAEI